MLKKSKLNQTDRYAMYVAANRVADMVVAFIQRRIHDVAIGSEQGDIDIWDDLVIEQCNNTYEHIQVKRQETDFDNNPAIRNVKRGSTTGELQTLSPLDDAMQALAKWTINKDPATSFPKRKFIIEIANSSIKIKKELQVRHLLNFCANEISPSTTVAKLISLQQSNPANAHLFNWLTSWCDFQDWAHILKALRHLTIKVEGSEPDIEQRTITTLAHCFTDPAKVKDEIMIALERNSSYTSAVTPRLLLSSVQGYLLPNLAVWTQYEKLGNDWKVSGTTDIDFDSIESATSVIDAHWKKEKKSELKLCVPNLAEEPMLDAMIRLMIHMPAMAGTYVSNAALWKEKARTGVQGTLGLSADDISDLNVIEDNTKSLSSNCRSLDKLQLSDDEAQSLEACMDTHTWQLVYEQLEQKITNMPSSELRNAIDTRWRTWKFHLNADATLLNEICQNMVRPRAEGNAIKTSLRLGTKTHQLLVEGFFLLLVISTALCDDDTSWTTIRKKYSLEVKVGKYWSGPENQPRRVRKLFSSDGFDSLLGKEPAKILLLSAVEAGQSELRDVLMSEGKQPEITLASPKQPVLIVTNSSKIEALIQQGQLGPIRDYLESIMVEPQDDVIE